MVNESYWTAHQVGRAERLAPRVVVRVARTIRGNRVKWRIIVLLESEGELGHEAQHDEETSNAKDDNA